MGEARILGDYILIKQIGQGTMGSVYLAEHRFMKKQYILKILPEELASERSFVQRFEEEVSILSSLDHPHIVKMHNVSTAQGQYFLISDCIVDEFGETTNLAQYMVARRSRFEEEQLFRLLNQVAQALDYAHEKQVDEQGLVHRNLKLNNILVAKGRGGIDLMISDFGLSKIIGTGAVLTRTYKTVAETLGISGAIYSKTGGEGYSNSPVDTVKVTSLHASFLQNFLFLAPEQRRLNSNYEVTIQADVYAFGVLAYYMLTGEFPEGIFPMPSHLAPELIWHWDALITSCLQFDPQRRPVNLVEALNCVRNDTKGFSLKSSAGVKAALKPKELFVVQSTSPMPIRTDKQEKEEALLVHCFQDVAPVEYEAEELVCVPETELVVAEASGMALRPVIRMTEIERPQTDLDPASLLVIDSTVKHYTPESKEVKNIQPLLTDMVVIQGGNFYRGSKDGNRDEMPPHLVCLDSFAIDIHPVTNEQFVRFLDVMGGEKDSNHQDMIRMRDSRIKKGGGRLSIESGYAKHPVVGVTWYGAVAYAKWIGKRLPTEAEWEIAARGGIESAYYPTGNDIEKNQANFFSSDTTSVMSYAPNGYGLYDVPGNVYEWCHDWYGYNYYELSIQEPENPTGPLQGVYRVLRGGCWKSLKEDLRCSRRHRNNPGTVNGTYGFRCAAAVQ